MKRTVYLRYTTQFYNQLQKSFAAVGKELGYDFVEEDRWDEVDVIWKPIVYGVEYKTMKNLKAFNNFLTSHKTLTEKLSLIHTGTQVLGDEFFYLHPMSAQSPVIPLISAGIPGLGELCWLTKPSKNYGGRGIEIYWDRKELHSAIHKSHDHEKVIQKYIEHPMLFRERKFDLRVHVLLTSDRVLYHEQCYVRVAPNKYVAGGKSPKTHLTNIMQNGEKGNLFTLEEVSETGITLNKVVEFLHKLLPLFKHAQKVERAQKEQDQVVFETFELLGIDILFDKTGRPWLLEINKDPAFKSEGFYEKMGPQLIDDTLKEAIFFKWNPQQRTPTQYHEF